MIIHTETTLHEYIRIRDWMKENKIPYRDNLENHTLRSYYDVWDIEDTEDATLFKLRWNHLIRSPSDEEIDFLKHENIY